MNACPSINTGALKTQLSAERNNHHFQFLLLFKQLPENQPFKIKKKKSQQGTPHLGGFQTKRHIFQKRRKEQPVKFESLTHVTIRKLLENN